MRKQYDVYRRWAEEILPIYTHFGTQKTHSHGIENNSLRQVIMSAQCTCCPKTVTLHIDFDQLYVRCVYVYAVIIK